MIDVTSSGSAPPKELVVTVIVGCKSVIVVLPLMIVPTNSKALHSFANALLVLRYSIAI